jgi:hypothetical protein
MVRFNSFLLTVFALVLISSGAFACLSGGHLCGTSDSACCSGDCVQVDGNNNNYCAPDDHHGSNQCNWNSDCGYGYECHFGQCQQQNHWGSCKPSGSLCGSSDSSCCSGDCVQVNGSNNNYCR